MYFLEQRHWCLSRHVQIISRTRAFRVTTVTLTGVDATAASTGPWDDMVEQWLGPQAVSCSISTVWGWWVKVPTLTPDGSCRAEASCPQWWPIKATCPELWGGAQRSSSMAGQQQVTAMTWDPEGRTQGSDSDFIDDKALWPPNQESRTQQSLGSLVAHFAKLIAPVSGRGCSEDAVRMQWGQLHQLEPDWCTLCESTLESPLDYKEIKPVNPKRNQSWKFIWRIDAEAEVPILWPPDAKIWLIGKDPDAGED